MDGRRASDVARAAWLYYLEEMTQGEVAKELGVSRSTVVRLLGRAKEMGLVRITLDVPHEVFERERELERGYGLKRVRLVPEPSDEETLKHWLGYAAAELLEEFVVPGTTVAVSWGTTLRALAASLGEERPVEGVQIVALSGGLHRASGGSNPYSIATELGRRFGAQARALHAPAFVEDRFTAEALMRSSGIQETVEQARRATLVVYSVGTLDDDATMVRLGYLSEKERLTLKERGAVGDIACHWIDVRGEPVEPPETINTIGISLDDLRRIPLRLAVAGGQSKREVVLGALRGGYFSALVTDEATANYLLG
jgi:DNA-binding transcriptional regulator LsrR (DeoR family)